MSWRVATSHPGGETAGSTITPWEPTSAFAGVKSSPDGARSARDHPPEAFARTGYVVPVAGMETTRFSFGGAVPEATSAPPGASRDGVRMIEPGHGGGET